MTIARGRSVLVLMLLVSTACRRDLATATEITGEPSYAVSDTQLVAFVRWQRDYAELLNRHLAELDGVGAADPAAALRDTTAFEAKVAAMTARQAAVMQALLDRVPLQGTTAELATEAVGAIFHYDHPPAGNTLVVARDEARLDAARRRFGKDAIDDIVSREALILNALRGGTDAAAAAPSVDGVPNPNELDAYVSGASGVRLGMTEAEVTKALGKKPSRRDDAQSLRASTDVAWDDLKGPRPGAARGRFRDDRLYSIEFAPAEQTYPRLDYTTADAVTRADYVRRSVARTLRMADIEAATGVRGYRASWAISGGFGSATTVQSKWVWAVDPGDRILFVPEHDGVAGQPVIRNRR